MSTVATREAQTLLHRSRFLVLLFAALLALCLNSQVASAITISDPGAAARKVVELTNQERAKAGALPLKWNVTLANGAAGHARDMAQRNYFSHTSLDGASPVARAQAAGYPAYGNGQVYAGENLGKNFSDSEGVVAGWMASPAHRDNLLRPEYREIGVAIAVSADGTSYWVQVLGSSPKVLPVFLNGDAPATDTTRVVLAIESEDVSNWGSVDRIQQVMVSNRPDFSGASWEPYAKSKEWKLPNQAGNQRVYVRMKDTRGRMVEASDDIQLTRIEPTMLVDVEETRRLLSVEEASLLPNSVESESQDALDLQPDAAEVEFEEQPADGDAV